MLFHFRGLHADLVSDTLPFPIYALHRYDHSDSNVQFQPEVFTLLVVHFFQAISQPRLLLVYPM